MGQTFDFHILLGDISDNVTKAIILLYSEQCCPSSSVAKDHSMSLMPKVPGSSQARGNLFQLAIVKLLL